MMQKLPFTSLSRDNSSIAAHPSLISRNYSQIVLLNAPLNFLAFNILCQYEWDCIVSLWQLSYLQNEDNYQSLILHPDLRDFTLSCLVQDWETVGQLLFVSCGWLGT